MNTIYVVVERDVMTFDGTEHCIVTATTQLTDAVECCFKLLNSGSKKYRIDLQKWENGKLVVDYINFEENHNV